MNELCRYLISSRRILSMLVFAVLVCLLTDMAHSAEEQDFRHPQGHFKLNNPDRLEKPDANISYNIIIDTMARAYARSGEDSALRYRLWKRFNDAPFMSADHGNRYVNIFANQTAAEAGYGDMMPESVLPKDAIVVKDSFTVTDEGGLFPGALFIMEKLEIGAQPSRGDWRYVMLLPDGTVFGDSRDPDDDRMEFCHTCHAVVADTDYLFQIPEAFQVTAPDTPSGE
jgi:hypothetical protein